jgi:hypothetical protein
MTLAMWDELLNREPTDVALRGMYHDWLLEQDCELEAMAQRAFYEERFVVFHDPRDYIKVDASWDLWCSSKDQACSLLWQAQCVRERARDYYNDIATHGLGQINLYMKLLDELVFSKWSMANRYSYPTRLAAENDVVRALMELESQKEDKK